MKYFYVSLLFACWSCSAPGDSETTMVSDLTMKLNRSDTLTFSLPDTIAHISSVVSPYFSYDDKSFSYLTAEAEGALFINRYFINEDRWSRVALETLGPNRVYGEGAYSFTGGKIFYFPLNESKVIKLAGDGSKLDEYLYSQDRMVAYNSQVKSPNIHLRDDLLYFDITEYRSLGDLETFKESKLVGVYNFDKDELNQIVKYPEEFVGKTWSPNDVGRNYEVVGDKIYMNFSKSKFIYVYNLEGDLLKKREVKVEGIKESQGLKEDDVMANALNQVNNGYYHKVIYDKWRNVFYRIGIHFDIENELKSPQEFAQALGKRTMTVLTFDKDLKVIANNSLRSVKSRLSESYYFVNEKGLYMYSSFDDSPEGVYTFVRLSLSEMASNL